ncbi:MAG: CHAT domain-containing protein [Phycisphaerales bacterium]|nr:CHAT domain-containing protein [Phycisphaerales bacterium]
MSYDGVWLFHSPHGSRSGRLGHAVRVVLAGMLAIGLFAGGNGPGLSYCATATQGDESAAATKATLAQSLKLLQQAFAMEQEGKLQESFDTARKAISDMEGISGLAELATRQYMLGQGYTLLGKILARVGQLEDAVKTLDTAMSYFAPFYKADALFFRQAGRPGSGFEHAANNVATALQYLSQVHEALKQPDEAIRYLRAQREFFEKLGQTDMVVKASQGIVAVLERNPEIPNGLRRRAEAVSELAVALVHAGQTSKALDRLKEADKILGSIPAGSDAELPVARALVALRTGYALQAQGRHADVIPFLERAAVDLAPIDGQEDNQLMALHRLFFSYFVLERFPQAEQALRRQIKVAQSVPGHEQSEYQARGMLVMVYKRVGNYSLAVREFEESRKIAERVDIPVATQARDYANIGVVHRDNDVHAEALASFETAIRLIEILDGTEIKRAEHHIDLANALTALGRPDEARARLESGLKLIAGVDGAEIVAARLWRMIAEDDEKRPGRSGANYRECLRIVSSLEEVKDADDLVLGCLVDIAREQQKTGRFDDAVATFRKVLDRLPEMTPLAMAGGGISEDASGKHERWVALTGLGLASLAAGRPREATEHLVAASRLGRDRYLDTLMTMSTLQRYRYMGTSKAQRVSGDIAVALSFHSANANTALAFETAVSSKGLFSEVSRRQREAVNRARGPEGEALAQRYVELRRQVARHVIDWQHADGSAGAESWTVEALFKEIREVERTLLRPIQSASERVSDDNGLGRRIASAIGRDQVLLEFVRFVPIDMKAVRDLDTPALSSKESDKVHYGVFVVSGATREVTAIDLGPATAVDDAILEYRRVQQSQSAPATFNLDEAMLTKAAEPLKRLLIDPLAAELRGARRIYVAAEGQLSLLPFEAIPVGSAAGRPRYLVEDFEVVYLTTGRDLLGPGRKPETAQSREAWLFGDPDFDAAPEAVMAAVGRVSRPPAPVETAAVPSDGPIAETRMMGAGVGDDLSRWPRLKRTRDLIEKVSIAARTSGMTPLTLTDAAASEPNATKMSKPRVVLFATHGKFLDRAPTIRFDIESLSIGPQGSKIVGLSEEEMLASDPLFRSMLVLAGANRSAQTAGEGDSGDGLLTAYEVWGLDLDGTELVALIACETGLGVVQGGASGGLRQPEGEVVAGLWQAFMVAGVRSMVMSMWPVPLGETARLFDHFFKEWLGRGEGRYTAFRHAQLKALAYAREKRGSGHPFWWAGFVFVGDPGDVKRVR